MRALSPQQEVAAFGGLPLVRDLDEDGSGQGDDDRCVGELLSTEEFGSLAEAQVIVEAWWIEYNTYRDPLGPWPSHPR